MLFCLYLQNLLKLDNRLLSYSKEIISKMAAVRNLEFFKFPYLIMSAIEFHVCICVPNFIKIGLFALRFYDSQDGGHRQYANQRQ